MYPDNYNLNYETNDTIAFFSLPYEAFNNWSAHQVRIFGHTFQTAEAAFQFAKFHKTAPDVAKQILRAPSPWEAFRVAKEHKPKSPSDWHDIKVDIMTQIIKAKVSQNEDVRQRLLDSGNKQIVENSPWDNFWGTGPENTGKNTLGKIYMKIRGTL